MKRFLLITLVAVHSFAAATLHNRDVLKMVRRGDPVTEIITRINGADPGFALFPEDVRALREAGVPDVVIRAMTARQALERFSPDASGAKAVPTVPTAQFPASPKTATFVAPSGRVVAPVDGYGIQAGTVLGEIGGGIQWASGFGTNANYGGGAILGFNRYMALFGQGGVAPIVTTESPCQYQPCTFRSELKYFAAGIETTVSNRSRIVPYFKAGVGYAKGVSAISTRYFVESIGAPAISFGGGARLYIGRRWGVSGDAMMMHFFGPYGGGNESLMTSFGMFLQSK